MSSNLTKQPPSDTSAQAGLRLVCISDTHGDHESLSLPAGDVLIHSGDVTAHGSESDLQAFLTWFAAQDFAHRIFVAGNHDSWLEREPDKALKMATDAGVTWLNDTGVSIQGFHFWGSPITPRFLDWSFMRDPGADIEKHWDMIPEALDVLITHGPPAEILDEVVRPSGLIENTGCPSLLTRIDQVKPRIHLFGHIHEAYGERVRHQVRHLNISTMDQFYRISNPPVVIDL